MAGPAELARARVIAPATSAPMRVLYEISTIGFGFRQDAGMAGVYRAMLSLMREARLSPDVRTRFATTTHPLAESRAAFALEHYWPGASAEIEPAWRVPLPRPLQRWLDSRAESKRRPVALLARAMRRGSHTLSRRRRLPETDVFHSLSYALPPRDPGRARVRFLTMYDMVPVKFPEYFGAQGEFMRRHFSDVARSANRPNDWVICISESTRRDFCAFTGMDAGRVFVTPLAAGEEFRPEPDAARLEAVRQRYGLPRTPFILSLCTLEPRKNLPHLIRAFSEMLRSDPARETHLVLAGAKGWDFDDLFREREALENCRDRIHCPGRIAEEDLAAVYSAAQFFVYPSLYEGFGLPALEALQCGLPVIASNTSSLPEVVGDAGLLVSPTDQVALVAAMRSLLDSADLRRELRARGLARAREFSWTRTMELTLAAYRTALAAAGGGDFDS